MIDCPESEPTEERPAFAFSQLKDTGLLWLINRVVFHPRGFALALDYETDVEQPQGWSLHGDGSEVWAFENDTDDDRFARVEALFAAAREHGRLPLPPETP